MDIRHTDNNGKTWVFSIDCTPYQAEILKNTLRGVSNIGGREKLTIRYYEDEDNETFCRKIERAILSALAKSNPVADDLNEAPGPEHLDDATHPGKSWAGKPQPREIWDDEPAPGYYWENF